MADQGQSADLLWSSEAKLELLGTVRLANSAGDDLTPKARKTRALLALVALAKSPVPRSRLIDLLWGDRGEEQAKASLRQALYELRGLAGSGYITADRHAVALGPKRLATDLQAVCERIGARDAAGLADALESVSAPLLGSLDDISPELDEWLRDERARISTCIVSGGSDTAEAALAAGDPATARRLADLLEPLDPLDERIARTGMAADLALNDRPTAIRRRARLAARLKEQLDIVPSAETDALLDGSRAQPVRTPATAKAEVQHRRAPVLPLLALLALLVLGAAAYLLLRASPVAATPSVAVLPFDDLGRKTDDYFASGVSDEILNLLTHQQKVKVLGRATAAQLANPANSLATAQKLGVTYLLDGSVRTARDRVLVIVRLTRVADGSQVWSERYERGAGDIFVVQRQIATAVAQRMARSFAAPAPQTTTPEVYDRYLAARQLLRDRREVTLKEAQRLLREAIARDPHYAPAFAELSQVTMLLADHPTSYGETPITEARAEALRLARQALELDPNLGDAYAALGFINLSDRRSEPYYRKAVALSPQRPEFHRWLAQSLSEQRRFDDAIVEYRRAVDIDPLWELNYEHLIGALLLVGRDDEARHYANRFLSLTTDQRAKMQFERYLADRDMRWSDSLRYSRALFQAYPQERQYRFSYASQLAMMGERRAALELEKDDPVAAAILSENWSAMAKAARGLGRDYWEYGRNTWNLDRLLLATGQQQVIVDLYDEAQPLAARGEIPRDKFLSLTTVLAMRRVGRIADADRLMAEARKLDSSLQDRGLLKIDREVSLALGDGIDGRVGQAMPVLLRMSVKWPQYLAALPAMSLRYDPLFQPLLRDRRFEALDENIHAVVNRERVKAGLPPISKSDWISDPRTLLTKN